MKKPTPKRDVSHKLDLILSELQRLRRTQAALLKREDAALAQMIADLKAPTDALSAEVARQP